MKLTIITVNLNNRIGLAKTLESVLSQTEKPFEYIVIDGGSSDGSVDLIQKASKGIDRSVSEADNGIYDAMNKGINLVNGEYLLFLNSGDCLCDNHVISKIIAEPYDEDFIVFDYIRETDSTAETISHCDETFGFLINGSLCHQAVLHKRDVFKQIGHYNTNLTIAADYELFLKAFYRFNCTGRFVKTPIVIYNDAIGRSKNPPLLREERQKAQEAVFDRRLVAVLNDQREEIEQLKQFRNRYESLRNSRSVAWALRIGKLARTLLCKPKRRKTPSSDRPNP